jgi:hypothetical protein
VPDETAAADQGTQQGALAKGERARALATSSTRAAGIDRHMIRRVASVSYGVNFKFKLFTL